jgi:hypothetical protein|tara:strand:+ start:49 stop:663 length:615 start_codon:yes stop_codon:yes gene_type:complete
MISNESPLLDGWISQEECDLVLKYMKLDTGTILETGSAIGRLFDYLYPKKPNWKYVSVDPLSIKEVHRQLDYNKRYWDEGNHGERITPEHLQNNIPFAEYYDKTFENFKTKKKFDIISMGMSNPEINWHAVYAKAVTMLTPTGVIIGRQLYNDTMQNPLTIRQSIKPYVHLEAPVCGSFVINGTKWTDLNNDEFIYQRQIRILK